MSTLSLRLPASLHERLREIAAREGVSINQLITLAAAEKVASILTIDYLEERARAANLAEFDSILDRVPDAPPLAGDELPEGLRPRPQAAEVRESASRYRATKKSRGKAPRRRKR